MPARTWTDEELASAIARSRSLKHALELLGLRAAGGNHKNIRRHIERLGLDTSHWAALRPPGGAPRRPIVEYLVRGSTIDRSRLKRRLYDEGLKRRTCELCGQGEEWQGRRMSLILDHVNGVHDDNRLENLRIVCPNCNATLPTHCGRNGTVLTERECLRCRRSFQPANGRQRYCSRGCGSRWDRTAVRGVARPDRRRVERPPYEELIAEIEASSWSAVGRRHGVSDNAVRKWVRQYEAERARTLPGPPSA